MSSSSGRPPTTFIDEAPTGEFDGETTIVRRPPPRAGAVEPVLENASLVVVYVPMGNAAMATELGRRVPLGPVPVTIGRHPSNALVLEQEEVSRRHAEVYVSEGRPWVRDLGSRNGTQVNGEDLQGQPRRLADGDRITVGTTILKFIGTDTENQFHEVIYRLKVEDALTQIHNKRYLLEFLDREMARAQRHRTALSLVLFDIDHFKSVNDTFGHLAGDMVLREVSALVKRMVRKEECFARYGGEEFCLVQPDTPMANAATLAEKVRATVQQASFAWEGAVIPITVSLGVAQLADTMTDPSHFIALADERLYRAKHAGRNRVVSG